MEALTNAAILKDRNIYLYPSAEIIYFFITFSFEWMKIKTIISVIVLVLKLTRDRILIGGLK